MYLYINLMPEIHYATQAMIPIAWYSQILKCADEIAALQGLIKDLLMKYIRYFDNVSGPFLKELLK
jgi:hypothetical protein